MIAVKRLDRKGLESKLQVGGVCGRCRKIFRIYIR